MAIVVVVCALASACAFAATVFVRSPQQRAAEAAPPPPSTLTAGVEERELVDTIVLRGTVGSEFTATITAPGPGPAGDPVVTATPIAVGEEILPGSVVAEVAGRPLIALPGEFPMYRDLLPGMEGRDVTQLQEALLSLGFALPEANGVYGPATQAAVEAMYDNRGYAPLTDTVPETSPSGPEDTDGPAPVGGPTIPRGELAFLPGFPSSLHTLHARVGELAEGPFLEVASGGLSATTVVSDNEHALIEVGAAVLVHSEAHGVEVEAEVASLLPPNETEEDGPEGQGGDEGHQLLVTGDFTERLSGADVRITIEIAATGEPVPAVPSAAVFSRHDGTTYLVRPDGTEVEVRIGTTAGGWVEVEGVEVGDTVVVSDT
ncbi:peptidoglycan-binding protein [Nocardiopsis alkaliphila]|uniref:peptidoglycan-binding protein n=1 Tax=Nocardiopsis alkaliphila TaxID=225762 RepID=UPI001EF9E13A|nr:peptidoglycan-binding protein [Nocardiopsis alkaliphila]